MWVSRSWRPLDFPHDIAFAFPHGFSRFPPFVSLPRTVFTRTPPPPIFSLKLRGLPFFPTPPSPLRLSLLSFFFSPNSGGGVREAPQLPYGHPGPVADRRGESDGVEAGGPGLLRAVLRRPPRRPRGARGRTAPDVSLARFAKGCSDFNLPTNGFSVLNH